jgi:predicted ABC-type exoprotein transport system permease subunit
MGKTEAAALIVGVLMPLLVNVLKQAGLPRRWNLLIALAACAGAGAVTSWATGQLTGEAVVVSIAIVFSAAQAAYQMYFRDSKLVEWIDGKTTIVPESE